jgi:hypothetical protein
LAVFGEQGYDLGAMSTKRMKVLVLLLLAGAGCADDRSTFFVRQVQAPKDDCTVSADRSALFLTGGTLDVMFVDGSGNPPDFQLTPLMENQMVARADDQFLRPESNGIQVDGAVVNIYETDNPDIPPEETDPVLTFFSYASSYIDPQSTGVTGFTVIPSEYSRTRYGELCGMPVDTTFSSFDPNDYDPRRALVLVGVSVQGLTSGGLAEETPEFYFPIDLCCGCLLSCAADADNPDNPGPDCCQSTAPADLPCNAGQDQGVDCRLCRDSASPLLNSQCHCGFFGSCPSSG